MLDQVRVRTESRTIFLDYNDFVQDFIFGSTAEDTYQLSLEVLPGAFEFTTEIQDFSGVYQLQYNCMLALWLRDHSLVTHYFA